MKHNKKRTATLILLLIAVLTLTTILAGCEKTVEKLSIVDGDWEHVEVWNGGARILSLDKVSFYTLGGENTGGYKLVHIKTEHMKVSSKHAKLSSQIRYEIQYPYNKTSFVYGQYRTITSYKTVYVTHSGTLSIICY